MRRIDFDIPVLVGRTRIMLPGLVWYVLDDGFRPTRVDPGESRIEIRRISVHVNDEDIDVPDWGDDPWVDDLCAAIYEEHNL